ncbi:hypothetical protein Ancab_010289 [Ancistrocladus abbreviatus]
MRRSFGGSSGTVGRGGGMFKTVGRVVRTGANGLQQETLSSTQNDSPTRPTTHKINTSKRVLSLSTKATPTSSSSPTLSHAGTTWEINSSPFSTDEFDWEHVDEVVSERSSGLSDDSVFGSPPSVHEAEDALSLLQQVLYPVFIRDRIPSNLDEDVLEQNMSPVTTQRASSTSSDSDWIEPSMQLYDWRMLQPHGSNRVCDAFRLLQTESSIQRMVISLSSDKAVWGAVLDNEAVQELRESFEKEENGSYSSNDSPDNSSTTAASVLRGIFDNMKTKFTEAVSSVMKLVTELFQHPDPENKERNDAFMEKLKALFILTVTVLLIVVATRAHRC